MTDSAYIIRNYKPPDFAGYSRLYQETAKIEPGGHWPSPQKLREELGYPNYSPERDLFIVETATGIVGCMNVVSEHQIGRVILNCLIHPEHRQHGLASRLLVHAIHRAEELGAAVAQISMRQGDSAAQDAISKLGFSLVRHFRQMKVNMADLNEHETSQASLRCCHLQSGEEASLTEVQNRSFVGSWGYHPNTVEEITYRLGLSRCSPDDVVLANDGNRISGYCWTNITSESEGQIYMIGVDPDFQGQGIGRRVLLAGLSHLKSKGFPVAELTVDSQNKMACTLYESTGFKVHDNILWYEKAVS